MNEAKRMCGNGADGISDIEGKASRVAANEWSPRGRERHRWAKPRGRNGREHMSQSWETSEFQTLESFLEDVCSVACLQKNGSAVVCEEKLLSFRKFSDPNDMLSMHAHSLDGFFVSDIGENKLAVVFE